MIFNNEQQTKDQPAIAQSAIDLFVINLYHLCSTVKCRIINSVGAKIFQD